MRVTMAKCYEGGVERIFGPFPSQQDAVTYVLEHYASLRWKFYYVIQDAEEPPKLHDYECKACSAVTEAWDMPTRCSQCGHTELQRLMPMPSLSGLETSASFLSGTKRKGFADIKEASKLEVQMADMHPSQRDGIRQEISKLKESK